MSEFIEWFHEAGPVAVLAFGWCIAWAGGSVASACIILVNHILLGRMVANFGTNHSQRK